MPLRRRRAASPALPRCWAQLGTLEGGAHAQGRAAPPVIEGIVWQPDNTTVAPRGIWNELGARQLLVQWIVVDDLAFVPGTDFKLMPEAARLGTHRAANRGRRRSSWVWRGATTSARRATEIGELAAISRGLAGLPTPLKVIGLVFPRRGRSDLDRGARGWSTRSASLPRPLWISVYDSSQCRRRDAGRLVDRLAAPGHQCLLPGRCRRACTRRVGCPALRRRPCRAAGHGSPAPHRRSVPAPDRRRFPRRPRWTSFASQLAAYGGAAGLPVRGAALCERRAGAGSARAATRPALNACALFATLLARSIASAIRRCASSTSPQPCSFTHLPGSRSL